IIPRKAPNRHPPKAPTHAPKAARSNAGIGVACEGSLGGGWEDFSLGESVVSSLMPGYPVPFCILPLTCSRITRGYRPVEEKVTAPRHREWTLVPHLLAGGWEVPAAGGRRRQSFLVPPRVLALMSLPAERWCDHAEDLCPRPQRSQPRPRPAVLGRTRVQRDRAGVRSDRGADFRRAER